MMLRAYHTTDHIVPDDRTKPYHLGAATGRRDRRGGRAVRNRLRLRSRRGGEYAVLDAALARMEANELAAGSTA
jgi:hypothetical protein